MTDDYLIPNDTIYLLVKISVIVLALLLWFAVTAAPVV